MNSLNFSKLTNLIKTGREKKHISQRELARRIKISNVSLNELENGRVKKPNVDILTNISIELDLSLREMLIIAGYEKLVNLLLNERRTI